jgi:hypothetical protein
MKIIDGVYRLETSRFSHIYYLPQEEILIDTGLPFHADKIVQETKSLGYSVKSILLTHHDIDHVGNVRHIQKATNASVWIGNGDISFLMGKKQRPGKKHILETILRVKAPLSCNVFSETVQNNFENINIFFTPGHTLRLQCLSFPLAGWILLVSFMLQTMGKAVPASVLAFSRQGLFLIPLLFTLVPALGVLGIQLCIPIADFCTFLLALPLGISTLRKDLA